MKRSYLLIPFVLLLVPLAIGASATADDGAPISYAGVQRLAQDDGPGMARFVRRSATEEGSLYLALTDCPWSQRLVWRAAATDVLLDLANDKSADTRAAALILLADVHRHNDAPSSTVVEALIDGIGDDVYEVRATAARVIGVLGSTPILANRTRLTGIARTLGAFSWEQIQLLMTLADHGVTEAAPLLLWVLANSASEVDRRFALQGLGALGRRVEHLIHAPVVKALREDKAFDVRRAAALVLSQLGRPADVSDLMRAQAEDPNDPLAWIIPADLAEASPDAALSQAAVLAWLRDPSPDVRREAAVLLGRRRTTDPRAVHALKNALLDRDERVRAAAAQALLALESNSNAIRMEDVTRWLGGRTITALILGLELATRRPDLDAVWKPFLPRAAARLRHAFSIDSVLGYATSRGPPAADLLPELLRMGRPHKSFLYVSQPPKDVKIALAAVLPEGRALEQTRRALRRYLAEGGWRVDFRCAALLARMPKARLRPFQDVLLDQLGRNPWPTLARARLALAVMGMDERAAARGRAALEEVLVSQAPEYALAALLDVPRHIPGLIEALTPIASHRSIEARALLGRILREFPSEDEGRHAALVDAALTTLRADPVPRVRLMAAGTVAWLD